jgi:hypothetical protein
MPGREAENRTLTPNLLSGQLVGPKLSTPPSCEVVVVHPEHQQNRGL